MSGTPFNTGQLGKLQSTVNIAVATALPKVAEKFDDPKAVLEALKNKTETLAGHFEELLAEAIKRMMVLVHLERRSLTTTKRRDPSELRTRKGLWVYGGFNDLVVSKAQPVEAGTTFEFDISEIGQPQGATDAEIEGALPKKQFDETAVAAIVGEIIDGQPNGEPGKYPTDRVILMYLPSCVVCISWGGDDRGWSVGTWERGDGTWYAGRRVFSPAT